MITEPDIIHKFEVAADQMTDAFKRDLPIGADVIHAAEQREGLVAVWYRFRRSQVQFTSPRWFALVPTGQPFHNSMIHRSTILCYDGRLVLHLVESRNP